MSSRPMLGEGSEASEITRLRREIAGLEQELQEAKDEAAQARQASADAITAIRALRKQTEPLFTALRMIHGEISRVEVERETTPSGASGSADPRWQHIKQKFPGKPAEIIELLLIHQSLTTGQLAAMAKADPRTITRAIFVLTKAQLIEKNSGKFSLRSL